MDVLVYGSALKINKAWVERGSPPGVWAKALDMVAEQFVPNHVLIALYACPLEFNGNQEHPEFAPRRKAMMRYYRHVLGVEKVGEHLPGMMYRIAPRYRDLIDPPQLCDGADV